MNYNEALDYIHSVSWTFCKPGLDRIKELCEKLGNPQKSLKFIHVAGTNGKGSFCSMLHEVLKESGYRVGLFTSPYIKEFNERIAINGESISNEDLAEITTQIQPIADSMQDKPTEFELITAIGFEYFKRKKCDYVVLECGLGGRLDSTNIIENTILSVITGIAFDHTAILGDTIPQIAREKAGIIKENIPVLWCGSDNEAKNVISNEAKCKNAPLYIVDRSTLNIKKQTLDGTFFDFDTYKDLKISLLGTYQIENAINVLNAVKILNGKGLSISDDAIKTGLEKAKWHARFEIISHTPLVIFDGGHNPQGVCEAVKSIKQYLGNEKLNIVTGVMADKDYNFIASKISEIADKVFCLTPDNKRALDAKDYALVYTKLGTKASYHQTVKEAVNEAIIDAQKNNKSILCLGSLYMYIEVINALKTL
ncbi:MAG: bifunctional folylpolyglutamate synthase/dihydrofolate synthase [Clostridia bacterium]|nr:bifunctional folylpolyglutamate synthase/dihydrofolate synthase [Clostridia bacterium]MBO5439055.1 bifunctional folylpolyglutamate synthase/dihydrofolate synthase [Clostridia bacterium]